MSAARSRPEDGTLASPDGVAAARDGGLQWVSDRQPGLARRRRGGGFEYRTPTGSVVRDASVLARIRALSIPPAWESVWICARADGHLQATGRDARNRKQYRYHADWQAGRGQTKFDGLSRFGKALPRIRQRVQRVLSRADEPTRSSVLATLVRLLDTTWLRIGNTQYVRANGSFGLSTLRARHAGVRGAAIELSFIGKSGVRHHAALNDRRVARIVRRCRELPGQDLFQYRDADGIVHGIDSADVNEWLAEAAGTRVTAKDFRTWHGSSMALEAVRQACAVDAQPCRATQVLAAVARRLGNTPAVCRRSYVHPRVLELAEALGNDEARAQLRAQRWIESPPACRGLSGDERRLMALLRVRGDAKSSGKRPRRGRAGAAAGHR